MKVRKLKIRPIMAIDPSPRGTGGVVCINDRLVDYWFCTETVNVAKKFPERALLLPSVSRLDENARIQRIQIQWDKILAMFNKWKPVVIGLEDYIWKASASVYQIAEMGGKIRTDLSALVPIRTLPPDSVKKAWTGSFKAEKINMVDKAIRVLWDQTMNEVAVEAASTSKLTKTTKSHKYFEGIADALAVHHLTSLEVKYRTAIKNGKNPLKKWPERIVTVFHRVTENTPCLLDREYLYTGVDRGKLCF